MCVYIVWIQRNPLTNKALTSIILEYDIDKGSEKEEYITRLPREKRPWAERCFVDRLMEGSFRTELLKS